MTPLQCSPSILPNTSFFSSPPAPTFRKRLLQTPSRSALPMLLTFLLKGSHPEEFHPLPSLGIFLEVFFYIPPTGKVLVATQPSGTFPQVSPLTLGTSKVALLSIQQERTCVLLLLHKHPLSLHPSGSNSPKPQLDPPWLCSSIPSHSKNLFLPSH